MQLKSLVTLLTLLVLAGCNDSSYSSKEDSFVEHIKDNSMMEGAVWLEQSQFSNTAEFDKTILVFGYYDDMENCQIIKKAMQEAQPKLSYRCRSTK